MNTHTRGAGVTYLRVGVAATCCVALGCAAAIYISLDPVTTARATLDACVRERLAAHGNEAVATRSGSTSSSFAARAASHDAQEQALSDAIYACSNQP